MNGKCFVVSLVHTFISAQINQYSIHTIHENVLNEWNVIIRLHVNSKQKTVNSKQQSAIKRSYVGWYAWLTVSDIFINYLPWKWNTLFITLFILIYYCVLVYFVFWLRSRLSIELFEIGTNLMKRRSVEKKL